MLNVNQQKILLEVDNSKYSSKISKKVNLTIACCRKILRELAMLGLIDLGSVYHGKKRHRKRNISLTRLGQQVQEYFLCIETIISENKNNKYK